MKLFTLFLAVWSILIPTLCFAQVSYGFRNVNDQYQVKAGGLLAETHADTTSKERIYLNGEWRFRFDSTDVGKNEEWYKYNKLLEMPEWSAVTVPGAWDMEHPEGFNRQTIGWYYTVFDKVDSAQFLKLCFEGVFREAEVWLNGIYLGGSNIPYLPFCFNITNQIKFAGTNHLFVRIDNRLTTLSLPAATTYHKDKLGWMPYGGITRPVYMERGLKTYVAQCWIKPNNTGHVRAELFLEQIQGYPDSLRLRAWIKSRNGDIIERWPLIPLFGERQQMYLSSYLNDIKIWSPESPLNQYTLYIALADAQGRVDTVGYNFAFKSFKVKNSSLYLNGDSIFLRGINRHEDHPEYGPVFDQNIMQADVALLKELNINFIRPGHYPNDVRVLKALENAGIMITEEIPVYQLNKRQMSEPEMLFNARQALKQMIIRDFNRPGIVMWSVANEIYHWQKPAFRFVQYLRFTAKSIDARPVMIARLTLPIVLERLLKDRISAQADVVGINNYHGWYIGKTKNAAKLVQLIHQKLPDKPLLITEFGAGAKKGMHLEKKPGEEPKKRHSYSEEFQTYFLKQHLYQYAGFDYVHGAMPWIFADFRMQWSPKTGKPHPEPLMNLKGLVSYHRDKKASFYFLSDYYDNLRHPKK